MGRSKFEADVLYGYAGYLCGMSELLWRLRYGEESRTAAELSTKLTAKAKAMEEVPQVPMGTNDAVISEKGQQQLARAMLRQLGEHPLSLDPYSPLTAQTWPA